MQAWPAERTNRSRSGQCGLAGLWSQELRVEQVGERRERHRRPGMAGVRLLDGVHGEHPDGVDRKLLEIVLGLPDVAPPRVGDDMPRRATALTGRLCRCVTIGRAVIARAELLQANELAAQELAAPALRRRLVQASSARDRVALSGPERGREDDAAPHPRGRDRAARRRARLREGHAGRAPRPAAAARSRPVAAGLRPRPARPTSSRSRRSCASSSRRWPTARTTRRRCAATRRRTRGSSTRAATTGATAPTSVVRGLGFTDDGPRPAAAHVLRRRADTRLARPRARAATPTCCCSTSRRTTSTSRTSSGSRRRCSRSTRPSSSSRTTAGSSRR